MVPSFRRSYEGNRKNDARSFKRYGRTSPQERYKRKKIRGWFNCPRDRSYCVWVKIGQDGKPIVRKFGNVDSSPGFLGGGLTVKEQREPLLDIITGSEDITIVAELPGVNKEDLRLKADNKSLTLESIAGERQYQKKIDLPDEIEPNTGKSTYKNGILEVSFKRKSKNKDNGVIISID